MTAHRVLLIDLVSSGQTNEVKKLIESVCDLNEKSSVGQSALMAAVQRNDSEILAVLINISAVLHAYTLSKVQNTSALIF